MFALDLKKEAKENTNFRKVLHTGTHCQIVAMSIPVNKDIGEEVHNSVDQILVFVDGEGEAIINGEVRKVEEHDVVFVPAGTRHNFRNISDEDLKLFTIYAPPEHPDGTVHKTKEDSIRAESAEKGGG